MVNAQYTYCCKPTFYYTDDENYVVCFEISILQFLGYNDVTVRHKFL